MPFVVEYAQKEFTRHRMKLDYLAWNKARNVLWHRLSATDLDCAPDLAQPSEQRTERDQIVGDLKKDEELGDQARNNSLPQFKLAFDPKGLAAVLERLARNESISNQFMSNEQLRVLALDLMMQQVYQHFQEAQPA